VPSLKPPVVQVLHCEDIFAVVDNGRAQPDEYEGLQRLMKAQAARFSGGIGCLVIIPRNATPPTEEARKALNRVLESTPGSLRCLCWLVEGTGFQGAMVRAVLTGLRLVAGRAYATHVSTDIDEALGWLLTFLRGSSTSSDIDFARREISRQRAQGEEGSRVGAG
jgi:hypothetical protein